MKFEEHWPRGFRKELFKGVDGRMDDGWQVITTGHPEPSAQVS